MYIRPNRMPGTMDEIVPESCLPDMLPRRPVHFPTRNSAPTGNRVLHRLDPCIARATHHRKNLPHPLGRILAHETRPGNVIVDGPGCILLGPDVEQNEIPFAN